MQTPGLPNPTPPASPPTSSRSASIKGLEGAVQHGLVPVADGVRLHYAVAGEGEPVVLLPGWPQSWYTWRFVMPRLVSAGRRVYAIDPRGLGDSDMPSTGYDLATGAEDLHTFIDQLGLAGE